MKEVSCKAFPILFKDMEKNNLPLEILCKDIPYNLDYLRNQKNNIEWPVYCRIMLNTRAIWNDDDYFRLGRQIVEWRVLPVLSGMLGFFVSTKGMYKLITSDKKGISNQTFRCLKTTYQDIDKQHIEVTGEMPEGYQYSREFFLISKGFFTAAPMLIKHKPSHVTMEETANGALYKITLPYSTRYTRWQQLLALPASRRSAIRELNESYELLYERYNELEESKARIQKHQDERTRISNDLHDEIGSTLSSINMYSAYAKEKPEEAAKILDEISASAQEMIEDMNDIIWSINPRYDSFKYIVERLRNYATRMAQSKNLILDFNNSESILEIILSMEQRKNLFLICKEAVNNAVKYSGCKNISVTFSRNNKNLIASVWDDGAGFDPAREFEGNGLKNIRQRALQMNATLSIDSSDRGTKINIELCPE